MKKLFAYITALFTAAAAAGAAEPQTVDWQKTYSSAVEKASKEKKPVLILFSGSDWCGPCKMLDRTVFKDKGFIEFADKEFVLYNADFPRGIKQAPETVKDNENLAKKYDIQYFPTILVTDASGKVLGTTGFVPGGPDVMKKTLRKILSK